MSKSNTLFAGAVFVACVIAAPLHAEGSLYYGGSAGFSQFNSESDFGETEGESATLGGVVGYRADLRAGSFWGVEADVSFAVDGALAYGAGVDGCSNLSPDWCDVYGTSHIRGIYGMSVGSGYDVVGAAGLVVASGRVEDGPNIYVDTIGYGYTVSVGVQRDLGVSGIGRLELVYDVIDDVEQEDFNKSLEILSLQASYLF